MLLRRIRGLLGLGLFGAVTWGVTGLLIGGALLVLRPQDVGIGEGPVRLAYHFVRCGLVAGLLSGVVLGLAERHRSMLALRGWRLTLWGAIGGLGVPWLAAAPRAMLPFFVFLGAATGATTWVLARRGATRELPREDEPRGKLRSAPS